ncbi:MAG TPA: glycosyltransferase [Acidimicrobiales bacterium]|nr:glycosyltransferase [Acidimicrobiales bacterium]
MKSNESARSNPVRTILIVTAGMGAGHLGAARQLSWRLERRGYEAPMFDLLGAMRWGYGRFIAGVYRAQLRHAMWSYRAVYALWRYRPELFARANATNTRLARRAVCDKVAQVRPVAIVSTYNLATQVLGALIERGDIDVPTFTFITDFGVHPYWLHDAMSGYATVHPTTAATVRSMTSTPVAVTGPFVDPSFAPDPWRRATTRAALGFGDDETMALVVAGAWGVGDIEATVTDLDQAGGITPVVVGGDHPRLVRRLRRRVSDPSHVLGFVDTMPALMDAADVLVENAGGLTAMEAFASRLPVITYRPIPAHGTDNAHAMAAAGVTRYARDRTALAEQLEAVTTAGPDRRALIGEARRVVRPDPASALLQIVEADRPTRAWSHSHQRQSA